jgi:AraC-like DNA-binding protein
MANKTYHASVNLVNALLKYASGLGLSVDAVRAAAHLSDEALKNLPAGIPISKFSALWQAVERQAGDANFGLHLAEMMSHFPSGEVLLPVLLNSPTLGDALEKLSRYHDLETNFVQLRLAREASGARVTWVADGLLPAPNRQQVEAVLYLLACLVRQLGDHEAVHSARKQAITAVRFCHARPADIQEHQRLFDCPLHFDQAENELVIRGENLALPIRGSDPTLLEVLEPLARRRLESRGLDGRPASAIWTGRVREWIGRQLGLGARPTIEAAAVALLVSERQVQKQLKDEGCTFQQLLDQVRREIAVDYLARPDVGIVDLAFLLGFAEQSAFNHAFKRWMGCSPRQYQQRVLRKDV